MKMTTLSTVGWLVGLVVVGAGCTSLLGNEFTVVEDDGSGGSSAGGSGTGASGGSGGMTPSHCSNMVRDEGETDVDCGGPCPTKCADGDGCELASDCASDNCGPNGLCLPPPPCGGACEAWQTCDNEVCTPGAVIYINLDGGSFSYGADDDASLSIQEVTNEALPSNMQAYGGTVFDQDAVFNPIVADFQPFNVEITKTRPPDTTPYQMVVVTPSGSPLVPNQKIWAPPPDCGDQDDNNVAFVIFDAQSNANEGVTPGQQGTAVSRAIGFMLGLENVNGSSDVMHNQIAGGGNRTFEDFCHARPLNDTWLCNAQHMAECNGNVDLQNSFRELTAMFGPLR
jgi:hypothetical protein